MNTLLLPNVKVSQAPNAPSKEFSSYKPSSFKTKSLRTFMRQKSPHFLKKERVQVLSSAVKSLPSSGNQEHLLAALNTLENETKGPDSSNEFAKSSSSRMATTSTLRGTGYVENDRMKVIQNLKVQESTNAMTYKRDVAKSLIKIGKAMNMSYTDRIHNLTGRQGESMIGLITLRALLQLQLNIDLTAKQIELIMIYFDHERRGEINLNDLIGTAQLYYDKWKRRQEENQLTKRVVINKLEHKERRKYYQQRVQDQESSRSYILSETLEVVKIASYDLIMSKSIKLFSLDRRLIMNSTLFQEMLLEFNILLTSKARKVLEERYNYDRPGSIDYLLFKNEFISLGAEVMIQNGQFDLLDDFILALSRSASTTTRRTSPLRSLSTYQPNDTVESTFSDQNLCTRSIFSATSHSASGESASSALSRDIYTSGRGRDKRNILKSLKDYTFYTRSPQGKRRNSQDKSPVKDHLDTSSTFEDNPSIWSDDKEGNGLFANSIDSFNSISSFEKSPDQKVLDAFLVAVSEGGRKRVSSPEPVSLSSSVKPSSPDLDTLFSSNSLDGYTSTGAGNGIWLNDQEKEYSFSSRSPQGKRRGYTDDRLCKHRLDSLSYDSPHSREDSRVDTGSGAYESDSSLRTNPSEAKSYVDNDSPIKYSFLTHNEDGSRIPSREPSGEVLNQVPRSSSKNLWDRSCRVYTPNNPSLSRSLSRSPSRSTSPRNIPQKEDHFPSRNIPQKEDHFPSRNISQKEECSITDHFPSRESSLTGSPQRDIFCDPRKSTIQEENTDGGDILSSEIDETDESRNNKNGKQDENEKFEMVERGVVEDNDMGIGTNIDKKASFCSSTTKNSYMESIHESFEISPKGSTENEKYGEENSLVAETISISMISQKLISERNEGKEKPTTANTDICSDCGEAEGDHDSVIGDVLGDKAMSLSTFLKL